MSRWERLLDQKPVSLIDHLVMEAAKLIAADFVRWPPEVEAEGSEGAVVSRETAPDAAVYRTAARLAKWDVASDLEAFDDYMRNRRYLTEGIAEADRPTLLFLCRWLVEQMMVLGEHTHGRINRRRKLDCLDAIARALPGAIIR